MGQTTLSESLRAVEAEIAAGRPDRAMTLGLELQSRYPRALAVQRLIGEIYLAQRKTREAIGALDRALAGNPEDARACCARAIVQQIHGNSMAALEWYRRACDTNPDDQVLRSAYRELASHLGQPPYQPTRMGLARLHLRGDLYPHAIREFESLLVEQPDALEVHVGLAETLWRAQHREAAEQRCRRILLNAPSCLKATLILAAIEHDAGHAEEAERLVRRAVELDPDQRMARTLFADRLAGGDQSLRMLLFGAEPQPTFNGRPVTAPLTQAAYQTMSQPTQQGASRAPASTPQLPELPTQRMESIPAPANGMHQAGPVQPLPGSVTSGPARGSASGRSSALPADFHAIFAETEYMLWGKDDERNGMTQGRLSAQPGGFVPPTLPGSGVLPSVTNGLDRAHGEPQPFARSAAFVPPALRDQGFTMEETEARAAINWLNWLQAQGARPQGPGQQTSGTGPLPPALGAPTGAPPNQRKATGGQPLRDALRNWSPQDVDPRVTGATGATGDEQAEDAFERAQTGPLPPASELRAMFAQLGPDTASQRAIEGSVALPPVGEQPEGERSVAAREDSESQQHPEGEAASLGGSLRTRLRDVRGMNSAESGMQALHGSDGSDVRDLYNLYSAPDEAEDAGTISHDGSSDAAGTSSAGVTLESIERGFAASGFRSFELRAGDTSEVGEGAGSPASISSIRELYGLADEPAVSAVSEDEHRATWTDATVASEPATPHDAQQTPPVADTLAPDDHPAHLERARQRRGDGKIDDALNDYRHVLRNAPDLLSDVVKDLEETMADAPDHPEIHRLLGDARIRQGDYLSALESYNRAVALTQALGS